MEPKQITEIVEKLKQEMRRGITIAAVMQLLSEAQYGYALQKALSDSGIEMGQDTLYPLLRRLEEQELLASEWRVEDPRPRRYYLLTPTGQTVLAELKLELKRIESWIRSVTDETK
jgi:DNA-binding PadR family transcriptional regulator